MQTSIIDIEHLITGNEAEQSIFPIGFQQLGLIKYKGNFTGFINDMVAYGLFKTNLGNVTTDLGVKITEEKSFVFAGLVETENFELSKLIENEKSRFDKISLDIEVKGYYESSENYLANIDGSISKFDFNNYQYNDIELNGLLANKKFNGLIKINDPNGRLNFTGKMDFAAEIPKFNFLASIENVQLDRLNLLPKLEDGVLSLIIESNFVGNNFDDLSGEINLINGLLYTPKAEVDLNFLTIKAERDEFQKKITLKSDLADGELSGQYNFSKFKRTISEYLYNYLPSSDKIKKSNKHNAETEDFEFNFNIRLKEINMLTSLLLPKINVSNYGDFKGSFNSKENKLDLEGNLKYFGFKNINADNVNIKLTSNDDQSLSLTATALRMEAGNILGINNISIHQTAHQDTLTTNVIWNNWEDVNHSGALFTDIIFGEDHYGERMMNIALYPSYIMVADSVWNLREAQINFHSKGFGVKGFGIENRNRYVRLEGFQHREIEDELKLLFNNLELGDFMQNNNKPNISFSGMINGELGLQHFFSDPLLTANFNIANFTFNGCEYGNFRINTLWDAEKEALSLTTDISKGNKDKMFGAGYFYTKTRIIDAVFNTDSLNVEFLNPFLKNVIQNIEGTASGDLYLSGPITKPLLTGKLKMNKGSFFVELLNTSYTMSDSVSFYPNEIRFNNLTVNDIYNHKGVFYGSIFHKSFKDLNFRLRLDADNMLLMNTRYKDNPSYYGTVFATGSLQVTGSSDNVNLTINGRTHANTRFFLPVTGGEMANESSFINFGVANSQKKDKNIQQTVKKSGTNVEMDIEVTPEAEIQIIFDERLGDILKGSGAGNIQLRVDRLGNIRLYGDYTIESGEYFFSLQNLINKRFTINSGGTLRWQGDPSNAIINITAVYRLRASLADLLGSYDKSENSKRRVPLNCNLILSENLRRPVIKFDIEAPSLDESTETLIKNFITTEEEMNRQVLSLLVLNRFSTPEHLRSDAAASSTRNDAVLLTTAGLLSQLNRWVSTISDLDVGVAYHLDEDLTSEEFELALSKQILNNRITLNGSVGYGKYYTNASKMIGDFEMDIKLNNTGTIRARTYARSNEYLVYETSPITQGIGISFREEYSSVHELFSKYRKFFNKKEEKKGEEE